MAQVREIKRRITSVRNTQQITRAMKMVAAAKLRKAQGRMLAMRPYAERLGGIIGRLAPDLFGDENPLIFARPEKRIATIVIAGDKGLCGGFNTNIIKRAVAHFEEFSAAEHQLWSIGKRATAAFRKRGMEIVHSYQDVFDSLSYALANDICGKLVAGFLEDRIDSAYVVYNQFQTVMSQKPTVRKILPIDFDEIDARRREADRERENGSGAARDMFELEPSPDAVMDRLVSRLTATVVYRATLESYAAELGARMTAMDAATTNADEMIGRLTMDYNRARQSNITGELLDIVGGAESLKG